MESENKENFQETETKIIEVPKDTSVQHQYLTIEGYTKYIASFEEGFNRRIDKIDEKILEYDKKIESSKLSVIETLGIFVALFTFVSIDFQVFRSYRDWHAITGLTLILLSSMSFLVSIFDFIINKKLGLSRTFFILLEVLFIISGIFLFSYAKNEDIQDKEIEIKQEILKYSNDLQKDYYRKDDLDSLIKENKNNGVILQCLKNKRYFSIECFSSPIN